MTIACPGCFHQMDARRSQPQHRALTGGVCSECKVAPRRHLAQVERDRAIAVFGADRTGSPAATERCVDAETRAGGRREWR